MNTRSDFFNSDFSDFLLINGRFFKKYEKKFVVTFHEYLKKLTNKDIDDIENKISSFYERLFIKPFMEKNIIELKKELELIYLLRRYNIDVIFILNRLFLLMSNSFIKEILKEKNSMAKLKTFALLCNFYLEYIKYHIDNTIDEESLIIPQEIFELYESKTPMNLFSIYKGIPIAHKTLILNIDEESGTVEVSANKYQIVAAKFHKEIFLLQNDKEYSYRAIVAHIRPYKKHLILKNIEKKQRNAPKRNYIRIQPKEEITVTIRKDKKIITSKIYDLSLRGMCIISDKKLELEISDFIKIEFTIIYTRPYNIKTTGEIKSITKIDKNTFKYHIQFKINTTDEKILEKYITKREKEIIKELNVYIQKEFIALNE